MGVTNARRRNPPPPPNVRNVTLPRGRHTRCPQRQDPFTMGKTIMKSTLKSAAASHDQNRPEQAQTRIRTNTRAESCWRPITDFVGSRTAAHSSGVSQKDTGRNVHLRPRDHRPLREEWVARSREPNARVPRASTAIDLFADPQTGVAPGWTRSRHMRSRCRCSMCSAIHINSRSWLRSSSTHEPSDPPFKVVNVRFFSPPSPLLCLVASEQASNQKKNVSVRKKRGAMKGPRPEGRAVPRAGDSLNLARGALTEAMRRQRHRYPRPDGQRTRKMGRSTSADTNPRPSG